MWARPRVSLPCLRKRQACRREPARVAVAVLPVGSENRPTSHSCRGSQLKGLPSSPCGGGSQAETEDEGCSSEGRRRRRRFGKRRRQYGVDGIVGGCSEGWSESWKLLG